MRFIKPNQVSSFIFIAAALLLYACTSVEPNTSTTIQAQLEQEDEQLATSQAEPSIERDQLDCVSKELLCIGVVTSTGQINDNSYNQAVWEGVSRAEVDLLARISYIETKNRTDIMENIEQFIDQRYDVVVTIGTSMSVATERAAEKYALTHFIAVDQDGFENLSNVTGLVFPEDKLGFLAGMLAAGVTQSNIVGVVLPSSFSHSAVDLKNGFEAGVTAISPKIEVLAVHHPGRPLDSLTDPDWGSETAGEMIDAGADVIFSGGGPTGNGALLKAASHTDTFCIGIDTDQWLVLPEAHPCLVSSVTKQLTNGVFSILAKIALDESRDENLLSDRFNGGIGLAPYHDLEEEVPAQVRATMNIILEGLENSTIQTDGSYVHLEWGQANPRDE